MNQPVFLNASGLINTNELLLNIDLEHEGSLPKWQRAAFSKCKRIQVKFVESEDLFESLKITDLDLVSEYSHLYLVRSDALFHTDFVDGVITEKENLIAVFNGDKVPSTILELKSQANQVVLLKLDRAAIKILKERLSEHPAEIDSWLGDLFNQENSLSHLFIAGEKDCCFVQNELNLAKFILGTKAETLERLQTVLTSARIPRLIKINAKDWQDQPKTSLDEIQSFYSAQPIIVRSSSHLEDGWDSSQAGAFDSVPNVDSGSKDELACAIDKVINSYGDFNPNSEVLIQEMLEDVALSGVVLSRTLSNGAPYYVINYDDKSGRTDSVTSGNSGDLRTVYIYRNIQVFASNMDSRLIPLLQSVREIEGLLSFDALDIEFAITKEQLEVNILQVRPLTAYNFENSVSDSDVHRHLTESVRRFKSYKETSPQISGTKTIFGVMPDANPAELIGTKPKPLAFSLYRLLITDEIVADERAKYGYVDVRPNPLMVSLAGHPYIDVRTSFNSFTPASIDRYLTEKLINFYIERLKENPSLHDKVEFEIVFTCWFADLSSQMENRFSDTFSSLEKKYIEDALAQLTLNAIQKVDQDLVDVEQQKRFHVAAIDADISPLHKAVLLIEDSRRVGTGVFVRLARSGFVAITMLKSFVREGYITQREMDDLIASLNSVTSQLEEAALSVKLGQLSFQELVNQCGHLRPGTYDITSPAYFEDVDNFIKPMVENATARQKHTCVWRKESCDAIEQALNNAGINISFATFEAFCRKAIEGREYSKFVYTKSLSHALRLLQEWGEQFGLSRDELAFLEWHDFLSIKSGNTLADRENLLKIIEHNRALHIIRESLELPILFSEESEIFSFEKEVLEPNYITQRKITAEIIVIDNTAIALPDLQGKIVLIPRADPGYDWLFSQQIGGLITMYGGANSHMAIRSAEQRLPAAIGVGERIYEKLNRAKTVSLNCESRSINVIN